MQDLHSAFSFYLTSGVIPVFIHGDRYVQLAKPCWDVWLIRSEVTSSFSWYVLLSECIVLSEITELFNFSCFISHLCPIVSTPMAWLSSGNVVTDGCDVSPDIGPLVGGGAMQISYVCRSGAPQNAPMCCIEEKLLHMYNF